MSSLIQLTETVFPLPVTFRTFLFHLRLLVVLIVDLPYVDLDKLCYENSELRSEMAF